MALITELIDGYADMTTEEKLAAIEKLVQDYHIHLSV